MIVKGYVIGHTRSAEMPELLEVRPPFGDRAGQHLTKNYKGKARRLDKHGGGIPGDPTKFCEKRGQRLPTGYNVKMKQVFEIGGASNLGAQARRYGASLSDRDLQKQKGLGDVVD